MAWDKLVMQVFVVVYHEYLTCDLIILCIQTLRKAHVYTERSGPGCSKAD